MKPVKPFPSFYDDKNNLECYVDIKGVRLIADGCDVPVDVAQDFAIAILGCVKQINDKNEEKK